MVTDPDDQCHFPALRSFTFISRDDEGFLVDDFGILLALDGRPDVPLWRATPPPPRARTFDLFRGGRGRGFGAHRGNGSTR